MNDAVTGLKPEQCIIHTTFLGGGFGRRLEGDYQVDDFGFDADLTENVLIPAFGPIYRNWFRVEVGGVHNVPAEGGALLQTIALHTEAERHAPFAREADLAYCLGPASARPYLDLAALERALVETGADAAWAGWGFVAEDPNFAQLCASGSPCCSRPAIS